MNWASIERDTKRMDMERTLQKAKEELLAVPQLFDDKDIAVVVVEKDDIRDAVLDFAWSVQMAVDRLT